jgi:hypothetical protein
MFTYFACLVKFFVAEKESVPNIHKQLTCVYGVNVLDKSTVSRWALRTAGLRSAQGSTETRRPCPSSYGPQLCTWGAQFLVLRYFNYIVAVYVTLKIILFDIQTINYMVERPSSEVVISSASLEIFFLWNQKIYYRH